LLLRAAIQSYVTRPYQFFIHNIAFESCGKQSYISVAAGAIQTE